MAPKNFKSNHFVDIMNKLNKERLESSESCDVTISAGSRNFSAHKCIVGGISKFYDRMFGTNMKEKYENKASFPSINEETMELLLNFIYTSNITITSENVYDVIEAANYMQIPYLKDYCLEFLLEDIHVQNCLSVRTYAKTYKFDELVAKANEIIGNKFDLIIKEEAFSKISFEVLSELLQLKNKQVSSEEITYNAVITWVRHDVSTRRLHFDHLFNLIKLENLSAEFLEDVVLKEALVMESLECTKLIIGSLLPRVRASSNQENRVRGFLAVNHNRTFLYDLATKQLQELKEMKADHHTGSVVKFHDEIYAVGGKAHKSVEKINLNDVNSNWIKVSSTNGRRDWSSSAVCGDYIYCNGGGPTGNSSGERFSYQDKKWSKLSKYMNEKRTGHALVAMKGCLYGFGGVKSNSMETFDPSNDEGWINLTPMKEKREDLAGVVLKDQIYAIGGRDRSTSSSSAERYDPLHQTWTDIASLNQPRRLHGACVIDDKIYVAGGDSKTIEVYDPTTNCWKIEAEFDELDEVSAIVAV